MYAKIINNSYWPLNGKKVRVVQFGHFLNHRLDIRDLNPSDYT